MTARHLEPRSFTADYVGQPGRRTFYLQAADDTGTYSYIMEKQQVALLAEKVRELILMVDPDDTLRQAQPARDPAMSLTQPIQPEWRVTTIGLAYEEESDRVVVFVHPEGAEGDETEWEEDDEGARFVLRREQARGFVLHALAVLEEGRPTCQLCGLPMDPEGHACPASNGHRLSS